MNSMRMPCASRIRGPGGWRTLAAAISPAISPSALLQALTFLPLVALIFFDVSGGPFGTEVRREGRLGRSMHRPPPAAAANEAQGAGKGTGKGAVAKQRPNPSIYPWL